MKTCKLIITLLIISVIGVVSELNLLASYRLPFADNVDLNFSQTWHSFGNFYNPSTYGWVFGENYAVDIKPTSNDPVEILSPENGIVRYVSKCQYSGNVVIEFGGYEMQFYHLNRNSIVVNAGNSVLKGQLIGNLYNGAFGDDCGSSEGTHLHLRFETYQGSSDPQRVTMSGFKFDPYDGTPSSSGASGCIMERLESGTNVKYCLYGYGSPNIFRANEVASSSNPNCTGQSTIVIASSKDNYICVPTQQILIVNGTISAESDFHIQ